MLRRFRSSGPSLLQAELRTSTLQVRLYQRNRIVAEVARGRTVPVIVDRMGCHEETASLWIHRINTSGFETFEHPADPQGQEPMLTRRQVREPVKAALIRPADLGLPLIEWSTAKLAAYCRERGLLPPITDEWVRRVLRREGGGDFLRRAGPV